ncbi:MAG: complement resistance protein TraT [Phycisphaerales bacterium]|jgi:hypothetical protein
MSSTTRKTALVATLLCGIAATSALSGCTAAARGLGKITANKYAAPRDGLHWPVLPPQLEPPRAENKTVYISYTDLSGQDFDFEPIMIRAAEAQGWTVVPSADEATYRLRARTRFFDEVEPESGGRSQAAAMGWVAGAAVGATTYGLVAEATDSWAVGVGAGAAAGGLVGLGMTNASKPREWAMITDMVLEERKDEPVTFELLTSDSSQATSGGGAASPRTSDTGSTTTSGSRVATSESTSNYFPHGVRLAVWANQMNMKKEEALPLIEAQAEKAMKNLLPR